MNKALKKAVKLLMIKLMTTLLPVIIILIILASALYFLTLDTAVYKEGSKSNVPYNVSENYIKNVKFNENGIYFEATDKDGKTKKITAEEIWDNLVKNKSDIAQYLTDSSEFEKLMNAEVITQYPKIGVPEGKLDGIIEFERHKTDNTTQKLKYISLKKFNEMLENENIDIVNYFTLDEEENLLIGIVDVVTEEVTANTDINIGEYSEGLSASDKSGDKYYKKTYTVTSKAVNYKNAVSKYTMPFQYLWSFLVVGDSKDFVLELADLVNNSSITISIYDNITTTVNTDTTTYKREIKEETTTREGNSQSNTSTSTYTDGKDYKVVNTTIYENNTPIIDLTKADVWMLDYSKTYKYQENADKSTSTNTSKIPDTEFKQFNTETSSSEVKNKDGTTTTRYTTTVYYERIIDKEINSKTEASTNKYVAGTPKINPKVDPDSEKPNFVTILREAKHKNVKDKVTGDSYSWLIEALEKNPDTVNMVDLTNYLLNKVLGKDVFDDNDFNFDDYEPGDFTDITSEGVSGNVLVEFLGSWENGAIRDYIRGKSSYTSYVAKYITQDKKQYICYNDTGATRNYGYGVCHTANGGATYMHVSEYAANGIKINSGKYDAIGKSKIDVEIVDNVKLRLLENMKASIKKELSKNGIKDLKDYQLDALTAVKYQYGNIGNFCEMYKKYGNTDSLRLNCSASGAVNSHYFVEVKPGGDNAKRRAAANWKLFHEGIYTAGNGDILDPNSYGGGNGDFLSVAKNVWKKVCTSGQFTAYGGTNKIPPTSKTIDCSGYVSWVIYEYGYKEFTWQRNAKTYATTDWKKKYGWEEISVKSKENPINKLKPGDIFARFGGGTHHVLIVESIKNGKLYAYDCGNSNNWLVKGKGGVSIDRSYFLTSPGDGKILRVKKPK